MPHSSQIKSKQRVAAHGEVFTSEREVKAMCDLVSDECNRIDSRFLEPACGEGAFLAEILIRKLRTCEARYGAPPLRPDYERASVNAVMSIYGVELLPDNAHACRERLFSIWNEAYTRICAHEATDDCRQAVKFILSKNILCGHALTMRQGNGDEDPPIVFTEWSFIDGVHVKRREFELDKLLKVKEEAQKGQTRLPVGGIGYDEKLREFIPLPKKDDYPPIDYRRLGEDGQS